MFSLKLDQLSRFCSRPLHVARLGTEVAPWSLADVLVDPAWRHFHETMLSGRMAELPAVRHSDNWQTSGFTGGFS